MFGLFKKKKKELSDEELNLQIQALEKEIEELNEDESYAVYYFDKMLEDIHQNSDRKKFYSAINIYNNDSDIIDVKKLKINDIITISNNYVPELIVDFFDKHGVEVKAKDCIGKELRFYLYYKNINLKSIISAKIDRHFKWEHGLL